MRLPFLPGWLRVLALCMALAGHAATVNAHAVIPMSGRVVDVNGSPVGQAMVSISLGADHGADFLTTFTDENGDFRTPAPVPVNSFESLSASARKLGYEQVHVRSEPRNNFQTVVFTVILRATTNQAGVAPASAWLSGMESGDRSRLLRACAGCHQMPAPPVLGYARLIEQTIAALPAADPAEVRQQSWIMIQKYMQALGANAESPAGDTAPLPGADPGADTLSVAAQQQELARILADHLARNAGSLAAYDYGAPLLSTPRTVMVEYGVKDYARIRDALLVLGSPPRFWFAGDRAQSAIVGLGLADDQQREYALPLEGPATEESFTLQRGAGGTLWLASAASGVVAHFDPKSEAWLDIREIKDEAGTPLGIHGLSVGSNLEVTPDEEGRIWFSHGTGPALGYFAPATGETGYFTVPPVPGRPADARAAPGDLVMSPDGRQVWYNQPGIGVLGAIDTRTHEFRTVVLPDAAMGPRRFTFGDGGVLYVPLFGTGQLLAYDTGTQMQTLYDLPDRASTPSAALFDPRRRVIWVSAANSDSVYRFDPATGSFAVQPLPRQAAYLPGIAIEPVSGLLVGPYVDNSELRGAQTMILTIDPGDRVYQSPRNSRPSGGSADAR